MPRPKRLARASGVARSMGGTRFPLIRCLCCGRWLPRDAIARFRRGQFPSKGSKYEGLVKPAPQAFCGECWHSGRVWRDPWVAELELEAKFPDA